MALVVADRVKEVTTTTGTGTISLGGAQANFVAFSSVLSDGDTTYYAIVDNNNLDYEVGLGTYASAGNTLARTTVLDSSDGGSLVNLSAGQKDVFITYPADKSLRLDANDKIAGDQTFSGTVTLNADPTSNLQAATKQYVDDTAAEGIQYHSPVRVEQEGNLTATYDNGTAGVGATLTNAGTQAALVIDGITMVVSDRVLIYEQTDATQNGVYTVTDVGSASTNWVLTRSTDTDSYAPSDPNALAQGSGFFVQEGTLGAGEKYVCNTVGTITFGTTDITFVQVATAQVYTGGTGINITGSVISSDATLAEVTANGASTTDNLTLAGITVNSFAMGSEYTLPTADGTTGQFLQTNGAGTVTFATVSTPTLDSVTDAGNNTANSITVGNINASDLSCNALTSNGIDDNAISTAITIDSSQNVGIGATSPDSKLHVSGSFRQTGATVPFEWTVNAGAADYLKLNAVGYADNLIVARSDGTVDFTNDVFTTGDFVAGKGSGSIALTINDSYGNSNIAFNHQNGTPDQDGNSLRIETNTDSTSGAYIDFEGKSNVTSGVAVALSTMARMYADSGDFHAKGNVIAYSTTLSDKRLKENVEQVTGALDMLDQIRGVTFDRKDTGKKSAGVIAQELEQVMPYAIYETALPLKTGNEDDVYKLVEYDALHAVLIEAIKELRAEVEELRASSN